MSVLHNVQSATACQYLKINNITTACQHLTLYSLSTVSQQLTIYALHSQSLMHKVQSL